MKTSEDLLKALDLEPTPERVKLVNKTVAEVVLEMLAPLATQAHTIRSAAIDAKDSSEDMCAEIARAEIALRAVVKDGSL